MLTKYRLLTAAALLLLPLNIASAASSSDGSARLLRGGGSGGISISDGGVTPSSISGNDSNVGYEVNDTGNNNDDNDGPCDESFPLADPYTVRRLLRDRATSSSNDNWQDERPLFVSIPDDDSRRSYAPLCDDEEEEEHQQGEHGLPRRRIDIRKLMRCNSGSCWNEYYEQCTFECNWSPPTVDVTVKPTPAPTTMTRTDNHILLELQELAEQYRMDEALRSSIINFLKKLLQEKLGYNLEILDAQWPGRMPGEPHSIPMEITALGPTDVSQFSETYVLELLRNNEAELMDYLKKLDGGDPFKDVELEFATYDPNAIDGEDSIPPSVGPTHAPSQEVKEVDKAVVMEAVEEKGGIPWWVWLIVAFFIILLICCVAGYCQYKQVQDSDDKNKYGIQNINNFSHEHDEKEKRRRSAPSSGRSTATGMKSQRPRRSTIDRDDATRRTTRTRKSTARSAARARTIVSKSFTGWRLPEQEKSRRASNNSGARDKEGDGAFTVYDDLTMNAPTMAAVSVLPDMGGGALTVYDDLTTGAPMMADVGVLPDTKGSEPPEEHVLVPYSESNGQQGCGQRDPTMYVEEDSKAEDPDGLKVDRKKSMFAADAIIEHNRATQSKKKKKKRSTPRRDSFGRLKSSIKWKKQLDIEASGDDPTEYNPNRRDPDAITSDEMGSIRPSSSSKNNKKKKKRSSAASQRSERRESFGDRLKSSFNWRARDDHDNPVDINFSNEDSDYDSPSIMTKSNDGGGGNDIREAINMAEASGYNHNVDGYSVGDGGMSHPQQSYAQSRW